MNADQANELITLAKVVKDYGNNIAVGASKAVCGPASREKPTLNIMYNRVLALQRYASRLEALLTELAFKEPS